MSRADEPPPLTPIEDWYDRNRWGFESSATVHYAREDEPEEQQEPAIWLPAWGSVGGYYRQSLTPPPPPFGFGGRRKR